MAEASAEVRAMLNDFLLAVETLEVERIAPFFEEDAQMFSPLGSYPSRLDGRPAIIAQFKAIADLARTMPSPLKLEPKDLLVREFAPSSSPQGLASWFFRSTLLQCGPPQSRLYRALGRELVCDAVP